MTPLTWEEVLRMKVRVACDLNTHSFEQCRALAAHQAEASPSWVLFLVAGLVAVLALGARALQRRAEANRAIPGVRLELGPQAPWLGQA